MTKVCKYLKSDKIFLKISKKVKKYLQCITFLLILHRQKVTNTMNTQETAKMTQTPYFIEYVCSVDAYGESFYYQLVRKSDLAILYASRSYHSVIIECWRNDIGKSQVTVW